jgi:hypothetical protein
LAQSFAEGRNKNRHSERIRRGGEVDESPDYGKIFIGWRIVMVSRHRRDEGMFRLRYAALNMTTNKLGSRDSVDMTVLLCG